MPKPLISVPATPPKIVTTRVDGDTPLVVPKDADPPAADSSTHVSGDAFGTSNTFEDGARAEFVSGQGGANVTAPTANSLSVRLPGAGAGAAQDGASSPLDGMRALVPAASTLGQSQAQALVKLVNASLEKAIENGDAAFNLGPRDLDRLLVAWDAPHEGYQPMADALAALGYATFADGFTGVSVSLPQAGASAPATLDADALSRALQQGLPAPPTGTQDVGARLGALVKEKLDTALAKGKTEIDLDTRELDRVLGRGGPSYDDVAKVLTALGYQTFADGFMGVSAGWQKSTDAAPSAAAMLAALADGVSKPAAAPSGVDALIALVESKIAAAGKKGEKSFDLSTKELDSALKGSVARRGDGYEAVAGALKARGFQAFADGFIGVSAGWD
jgi:hypothetical protein